MTVSPLAPAAFPELAAVAGVSLSAHAGELRYTGRPDLMLAAFPDGATVAGVFTRSLCPSAPVDWCRRHLAAGFARAMVCNAGNANAFTGAAGDAAAALTADVVADAVGCAPEEVFLASTGVIGEPLDEDVLRAQLPHLTARVGQDDWRAAAEAIRTTDTFAKGSGASVGAGSVVGIAKGSGMIAPDMATMLAFVFTDLAIDAPVLQECLNRTVAGSFNAITVDSDTSTSDTVLLFATGAADPDSISSMDDPRAAEFCAALEAVTTDLAQQIVRDGEGASKLIEVTVRGAETDVAARTIAMAIADSPLVKTALGAADANWGRIVMAVGKAGERADRDALVIWIGDEQVTEAGMVRPGYSEERATAHLQGDEVLVRVDVGIAEGAATVWTCDLTHGYIDINASYRS